MGYLNENHGYGDAGEENFVNPFSTYDPFAPVMSEVDKLRQEVEVAQKELSRAKKDLNDRAAVVGEQARKLHTAKRKLREAEEAPKRALGTTLRKLPIWSAIQFTTAAGYTYVALKTNATGSWYLTQNGHGSSPKGVHASSQLADLIGTAKVRYAIEWREL